MKVIEHGRVFVFDCKSCGCKYAAGVNESTDCGFFFKAICPECGSANEYKDREEKKDADRNEQ